MPTYSYDLSTDVGKLRAIFPDMDQANPIFSDEEIGVFLDLEGDVRRGCALALERVAADTAMTLRVTTVPGMTVDGARTSDALLKRATQLRDQATDAEARSGEGLFDIAEFALPPFGDREVLRNAALREGT